MELENFTSEQPEQVTKPQPKKDDQRAEFLKILKESLKKAVMYIMLFSSAINILMLFLPLYSLQVFDRVLSSGSIPTLTALSMITVFSFILYSVFNSIREYMLIKISAWLDLKLNERVFKLSVNHSSISGQKMNSQFIMEAASVKGFVTSPQIFALFDIPWSFVYFVVIFLISPQICLLVLFGAAVLFGLTYYKEFKTKPQIKETNDINHRNMKRGDEFIRNAEVIEAMGMYGNTYELWRAEHEIIQERVRNTAYLSSRLNSISKCLRMTLQIAIIGVGTYLALSKQMTFGGIIACSILAGKALQPFDAIMAIWSSVGNFRDSYAKLNGFLNSAFERPVSTNLGKPRGEITCEKVVFLKPGSLPPVAIIKNLDLAIDSGDVIGLIGPSGSGKSTLIKLLAGIYKPAMGVVRVDGGDIFHRNREDIGRYIGYLPQSIDLLRGTIKENICRFDPNVKDEDVVNAAKKTGVHELILSLPEAYDTVIGEGNVELSGGQKQRIGIARAFYGDPSIILLDEPNANLDGMGEQLLLKAIIGAKNEGRTLIMISHKPSIVNITNKIVVIRDGAVMDYGLKDDVMTKYAGGAAAANQANINRAEENKQKQPAVKIEMKDVN